MLRKPEVFYQNFVANKGEVGTERKWVVLIHSPYSYHTITKLFLNNRHGVSIVLK
jgi:hypothetical protein